ncbi:MULTISPECIES: aromatic-ring-hydroxylating dioxygenase subunit beta [Cytobacillus]|uniref:Aromatic-ring-hydroxylating dioxygenase subunit beta n=1 Tax=Cytobacillus stercorigallinarum TaxID=2762240 RepID=A0ABR8QT02_9BACI|nr:aromatic-ring-hydroxylating dioxygenase subunit beta [Cytobacillus stercorigallinarum]MBD7938676.1 aromatic-ring-hydroxylating dioxygenase subunit beta [Cytobacillus stercorigallinarum]
MIVKSDLKHEVIDFLYHEAKLLDQWKLQEWANLFSENGTYIIPPIGEPEANPLTSMFYIYDDRARLEERAKRLLKKEAHVEYPHSTTLRNYHNIMLNRADDHTIHAECNFTTYRTKREVVDTFLGTASFSLKEIDNQLMIEQKKVVLQLDSLRPQGKISLIL